MRTIEEIKGNRKYIYSGGLEIAKDGMRGYLNVDNVNMTFVASWGCGWDHVSVAPLKSNKMPTWDQMCKVKEIFFREDEAVIQIHPPKDQYVNNKSNCLHLWRSNDKKMLLPPSFMVGLRKGQSLTDVTEEYEQYRKKYGYEF
jgi:hypothetical protein